MKKTPWWQHFPRTSSLFPKEQGGRDFPDPTLAPGTWVRLRGKPEKPRRVLRAEWHRYHWQFVYIVETSGYFDAYWFAEQLVLVKEPASASPALSLSPSVG
ncbi:hypothetical protein [Armatimonas sp.]|uniref:hypothetical protein n=1 Tax=Armatimonas sp. TaxID=1872638 RepID=UPI002869F5A0|nr:hypothetical protein [Armatimonas sp.]